MTPGIDLKIFELFARYAAPIVLVVIAFFLIWLVTIIDIVTSEFDNNANKIIWFFFVMMLAPVGVPLYFFIGRAQKTSTGERYENDTRYRNSGRE
jgi:multisubunit Na+/H+ antiporter MnhG subunit